MSSYVYDLSKAFDIERKILLYCGFYPNQGRINKFLYYFSGIYHLSISLLIHLSLTILIGLHINNLSTIAEALMFFITQTAFVCKLLNVIKHKRDFTLMEEILSEKIFYRLTNESARIVENFVESTKRFAVVYRIICFLVCATNGILPLLGSKVGHAMVLGWNPWGVDSKIKYYVNSIFQLDALCVSAYVNSTIDIITYMTITVATAQMEVLKNNLVTIKYDYEDANKQFKVNVKLHSAILRFVDTIQKGFSLGILIQIFASVLVFCFTGFQMIIIPIQSVQFVSLLIYFTCMMAQVAMYCWFGHYLIDSSDSIINSLYMSNWYEADTSLKRSIFIFMERCKKPVILRAGNLFPLSLVTFTSVMRSSYSYFAVLRRLYDSEAQAL